MGGAVSTTFIAGVEAIRRGIGKPVGSLTQMARIRLGKRTEKKSPLIKDFIDLAGLDDLVFAGWDIYPDNCYEAAIKAGVLERDQIEALREPLEKLKPLPAVFSRKYVKNLDGRHLKKGKTKMDLAKQVIDDIEKFRKESGVSRLVMVWCGSTEVYIKQSPVHASLSSFEKGLRENHDDIAPSMIYAYAALKCGVPYANGAPNLSVDFPALMDLAKKNGVP
ncbi:MAG: inositol-3-phosphate synthase, partial [Candidatus Dadabacteria bacterium]|nr:inositol-3-phosphate synthase [Candidatus Dadabacteria bacterium]